MSTRIQILWYAATIFLSSAILLVLEITAGRLIAPYVGVTIYSWTSIIGVILAGLSLGNWIGGVMADRGAGERATGITLVLAAVFSLMSLWALMVVAPSIQESSLDLISSSFLYALVMFFIPAVMLGIPTPLLTTLALHMDERTGHIVGRMHALAALGSIVGTFITGFVLIQYIGSRNIVIVSALILFVLALPFFRKAKPANYVAALLVSVLAVLGTWSAKGFENPCDEESHYFCLRVVDASESVPYGNANALILDHLLHGINHQTASGMLVAPYVHLMQELVGYHFGQQEQDELSYFFAGGGSYTQPRAVKAIFPDASVTVAELDPVVTDLVQEKMFVNIDGMDIVHGDARTSLQRMNDIKFDVVVTDAFHDIAIPYHLVTQEYAQLVKRRLSENGIYTTNVVDSFPDPRMVKSIVKTLSSEFKYVDVWLDTIPDKPERMTFVVSAQNVRPIQGDRITSQAGFERHWYRISNPLVATGTPMEDIPVFTDDYVPVERMISTLLLSKQGA